MFAPAGESLDAFSASEFIGQEIQTILTHREDVLHSFNPPLETDIQPDPTDLQANYISHLRAQRETLLSALRVHNSAEILRNPERFFATIVSEFQELHRERRVWGRPSFITRSNRDDADPMTHAESSYVATYDARPYAWQPALWTAVAYDNNNEPVYYTVKTKLHHAEDWQYVFRLADGELKVFREGYERGRTQQYEVRDELDRATLLQALGVEMLASEAEIRRYDVKTQAVHDEIARRTTHKLIHFTSV